MNDGFASLDGKLRELIRESRKPAETIEKIVYVNVPTETRENGETVPLARPVAKDTWSKVFGLKDDISRRNSVQLWDASDAPAVDPDYVWPADTDICLSQLSEGQNVYLFGPPGTGKTSFGMQLAARLRRPVTVISCNGEIEAVQLFGQKVPHNGSTVWQDGQLTAAIRRPGMIIVLDEPSTLRPTTLVALHHLLQFRELYLHETGEMIRCAASVLFIACDNTNASGRGARKGFTDTNALNLASRDRFGAFVHIDYMPHRAEVSLLTRKARCTPQLARILVKCAKLTRTVAASGNLVAPIGLRSLISWAQMLRAGIEPERALAAAILHKAPEQDVETLKQQTLLAIDRSAIAAAVSGQDTPASSEDELREPDMVE